MSAHSQPGTENCSTESRNISLTIVHLVWLFFGPLALMTFLQGIGHSAARFGALDFAYFAVVAAMIFARWYDQRSGQCVTATGVRSTWKQFRHFVFGLLVIAISVWTIAKLGGADFGGGG